MEREIIPKEEQHICEICNSTYDGVYDKECLFSDRPSHQTTQIEPETLPVHNEDYVKALSELNRNLHLAISLTGDMVNRYQDTVKVLIPTLQAIQKNIQDLQDVDSR